MYFFSLSLLLDSVLYDTGLSLNIDRNVSSSSSLDDLIIASSLSLAANSSSFALFKVAICASFSNSDLVNSAFFSLIALSLSISFDAISSRNLVSINFSRASSSVILAILASAESNCALDKFVPSSKACVLANASASAIAFSDVNWDIFCILSSSSFALATTTASAADNFPVASVNFSVASVNFCFSVSRVVLVVPNSASTIDNFAAFANKAALCLLSSSNILL